MKKFYTLFIVLIVAFSTKAQTLPTGTVGYYKFENNLNTAQTGELITDITQTTVSAFETDATRGTVWYQQEGWHNLTENTNHANGYAYTRFDNPL